MILLRVYIISLSSKFACLSLVFRRRGSFADMCASILQGARFCTDAHIQNSISGVNWVAEYAKTTGRPSVVSLAVSGDSSTSTLAVANLVSSGVTVVLPAGNDNVAAEHTFLSYLPSVLTVGASTIADTKADYSNWGAILDIWAPGMQELMSRSPKPSHPFAQDPMLSPPGTTVEPKDVLEPPEPLHMSPVLLRTSFPSTLH